MKESKEGGSSPVGLGVADPGLAGELRGFDGVLPFCCCGDLRGAVVLEGAALGGFGLLCGDRGVASHASMGSSTIVNISPSANAQTRWERFCQSSLQVVNQAVTLSRRVRRADWSMNQILNGDLTLSVYLLFLESLS